MKLGPHLLPGHSLIRFRSMKYSKAAVWNQSSTLAKFYLRDMSQQAANLQTFGPLIVAQKVVGGWGQKNRALTPKED